MSARAGFSLVETALVLVTLGIVLALAAMVTGSRPAHEVEEAAHLMMRRFDVTRTEAMMAGRWTRLYIDVAGRRYAVRSIPEGAVGVDPQRWYSLPAEVVFGPGEADTGPEGRPAATPHSTEITCGASGECSLGSARVLDLFVSHAGSPAHVAAVALTAQGATRSYEYLPESGGWQ